MANLDDIEREFEQLFDDVWRLHRLPGRRRGFRPQVDCFRTDDPAELTVIVELAGVEPEDIEIFVDDRALLIAGERRRPHPECRLSYYQMEIEYGPFQRRIALAEDVDADGARATYERGLLMITLPLAVRAPRSARVSIQVRKRWATR